MSSKSDVTIALMQLRSLANSPITDGNVAQIVENYFNDLQDIAPDLLAAAVQQYRASANAFFPSSGQLRDKATELQLLAMNVPTAAEAWAQVQRAYQYQEPVYCEEGAGLRNQCEADAANYFSHLFSYSRHIEQCTICTKGGYSERYDHPAVARVVELLGGRDMLMTDNEVADRAKFFESYNAIVKRETLKFSLPTQAREYVQTKQLEASNATKLLAERLSK